MKSRKIIVTEAAVVCALCSLGTVCLPAQTAESLAANRSMSYAAILSKSGTIYTGVCIDTCSTLGICAERNAIFNMITNGEQEIDKVICVLEDGTNGAPCGACCERMVQLMPETYSGECNQKYDKQMQPWGSRCFEVPDTDGNSKVIMDDGSVYYILINEGGERRTDDSGVFHETTHLQYSATKEMAWNLGSNRIIIDLDKVQSVIINGDMLYRK